MLDFETRLKRADERVGVLEDVSLFADVRGLPGALEQIARIMELRTMEPGQAILREGESGSEMFLLIEGQASVHKTTAEGDLYKVTILTGNQHPFFGEGGLLDSDPRSATILADTRCHCLVLGRAAFEEFGRARPEWALPVLTRIARAVMARQRKTNVDLTLLYNALVAEIRGA